MAPINRAREARAPIELLAMAYNLPAARQPEINQRPVMCYQRAAALSDEMRRGFCRASARAKACLGVDEALRA